MQIEDTLVSERLVSVDTSPVSSPLTAPGSPFAEVAEPIATFSLRRKEDLREAAVARARQKGHALRRRGWSAEADCVVTRAMAEVLPAPPDHALLELRSLLRSSQREFPLALSDAQAARKLAPRSVDACVRESRALIGLERWGDAAGACLRGLAVSPSDSRLATGFVALLPTVERKRHYFQHWQPLGESCDGVAHGSTKPSAPRRLALSRAPPATVGSKVRDAVRANADALVDTFREMDRNGDGTVSRAELRRAVPRLGLAFAPSRADIDALFDELDVDGSNLVGYEELHLKLQLEPQPPRAGSWGLGWDEPGFDGGDEVFEYQAKLRREDLVHGWTAWRPIYTGGNAWCAVPARNLGTENSVRFELSVTARNGAGWGETATIHERARSRDADGVKRGVPPEWKRIDLSDLLGLAKRKHGIDPAEHFAATHAAWAQRVQLLKMCFRYYAAVGVTGQHVHAMSMDALFAFARDCGVVGNDLTPAEIQGIFVRANINRADDDDSNDRPDRELEHPEFVAAVSRLAREVYPRLTRLDEQVARFLDECVAPNAKTLLHDELADVLAARETMVVLRKHRPALEELFGVYSAAELLGSNKATRRTLNMNEWHTMLREAKLIDARFTVREATLVFVKVNLHDELYHSWDEFDSEFECTYDEFQLMIARLVAEKADAGWRVAGAFDVTLNAYLDATLLPIFARLVRDRKEKGLVYYKAKETVGGDAST